MVDGEIAEVEEAIAHAGVFPVDDANRRAVVDEIRVQQIVVAEHGRLGPKRALDVDGDGPCPLVRRWQLAAMPGRGECVRFHDSEGRESAGATARSAPT